MNEDQIVQIISKIIFKKHYFVGVTPANQQILKYFNSNKHSRGLIINTDNIGEPGTHWCALHMGKNNTLYFFDSFGRKPQTIPNIWSCIKQFKKKKLVYSNTPIQSIFSSNCGLYSIYFLFFMHHYCENMNMFIKIFNDDDLSCNEQIITNLFSEIKSALQIPKPM